ncbi:hypothetical protein EMIT0158MI4_230064 [Burkholderia ambifaria]
MYFYFEIARFVFKKQYFAFLGDLLIF